MAILLSVIWFLAAAIFSLLVFYDEEMIVSLILLGCGPLILLWGIYWVILGFTEDK